jgi:hypothetical protein
MPPLAPVDEYTRLRSMTVDELERLGLLHDIHFDFDRWHIREDARPLLARNAEVLRRFDFIHVTVQGHCDARGTVDYTWRSVRAARRRLVTIWCPWACPKTASGRRPTERRRPCARSRPRSAGSATVARARP